MIVTGLDTMFSAKSMTAWAERSYTAFRVTFHLVVGGREEEHLAVVPQILVDPGWVRFRIRIRIIRT